MTGRYDSSSLQAMAQDSLVAFRLLFDVGVTSSTLHFCTGRQHQFYNANTYTAVGGLGFVEPMEEETDGFPRDITFGICGVNTIAATGSMSIYEPLQEHMAGRPVKIYRQFLDPSNLTAVHTPEPHWDGYVAGVNIDLQQGIYQVRAVDDMRNIGQIRYMNRESFRRIDSSDTFGDWVDQVPLFKGSWGGSVVDFSGGNIKRSGSTGGGRGIIGDLVRNIVNNS